MARSRVRLLSVSATVATPPSPRPPLRQRSGLAALAGFFAALGLAVAVVAACVSRDPATTASELAAERQVCALLSTAQAAAAADALVETGQPGDGQEGPRCDWYTTAAPRRAAVQLERIDANFYEAVQVSFAAMSIAGLGDEAYLAHDNALYVRSGTTYLRLVVSTRAGGNDPAAEQRAAAEALTHLAR